MRFDKKQIIPVALILALALSIRIAKNYFTNFLSLHSIILSTLTIIVLLIAYFVFRKLTTDKYSALFALAIAAVMPLEFDSYLWAISAIFFFLTLAAAVSLRKKSNKINRLLIYPLPILAAIIHFSSIILVPIFTIYIVLLALEHDVLEKREVRFLIFSILASLILGMSLFGMPSKNTSTYVSIATLFTLVGTRPILFGVAGAYYGIKNNISQSLIFVSSAGVMFFLLSINILPTRIGLFYLFISLAGLSGIFFDRTMSFLKKSRLKKFHSLIQVALFVFILITGLIHWI